MKKEIKQETINKYIWDWVRYNYSSEIKEYKNHIKNYGIEINLKQNIIEYINQGQDESHFFKELLNGQTESEIDVNSNVIRIGEEPEEEDDNKLIKFVNEEEEMFYNNDFDSDWIVDNIMEYFLWDKKDYDKYTSYCSSYTGSLNLKVNYFDGINSFELKYRNKKDIEEHLDYDLDFIEMMNIILIEEYKDFKLDYEQEKQDIKKSLKSVKEELNKRLIEYKKEKNKILKELKLIDCNNDYLIRLINIDLNSVKRSIEEIEESLK
jgi:hypothetical protein